MSTKLLDQVYKKLDENKLVYEIIASELPNLPRKVKFKVLAGREEHDCIFFEKDEILNKLNNSKFEKYRFIVGYEAIWSSDLKRIECEVIQSGSSRGPLFHRSPLRRLSQYVPPCKRTLDSSNGDEVNSIELQPVEDIEISIGWCSEEFAILSACRQWEPNPDRLQKMRITLKLSNVNVNTHEEAHKVMVKISNSLFFQIDLLAGLPINLVIERENHFQRNRSFSKRRIPTRTDKEIETPKYEYDPEPMALYWYAKNNSSMPLFQFLAYYQTIEFYFPIYSNLEAKQRLQNIIKDPRFNPNRDADITKVLNSIKLSAGGKTFGNEAEQLKATIKYCTNEEDLREFFEFEKERSDFYLQEKGKKLSSCKLSLKNEKSDLIKEVTDRIYDIRCRIVHTKSDGYEIINPFSPEVRKISYDLELIEFIARKVLISSCRPLKIS